MKRNVLTFINHACFTVQNESALLLVDPWLEAPAFNNGFGGYGGGFGRGYGGGYYGTSYHHQHQHHRGCGCGRY